MVSIRLLLPPLELLDLLSPVKEGTQESLLTLKPEPTPRNPLLLRLGLELGFSPASVPFLALQTKCSDFSWCMIEVASGLKTAFSSSATTSLAARLLIVDVD